MTLQIFGIILSSVLGFCATLISALVLWRLNLIDKRIDKHDEEIRQLDAESKRLAERKIDCQTEFVSAGRFLQEAGYTRKRLDDVIECVKELSGKFDIVGQLPQICGQIASQTVKELVNNIQLMQRVQK